MYFTLTLYISFGKSRVHSQIKIKFLSLQILFRFVSQFTDFVSFRHISFRFVVFRFVSLCFVSVSFLTLQGPLFQQDTNIYFDITICYFNKICKLRNETKQSKTRSFNEFKKKSFLDVRVRWSYMFEYI
jgi:hypothetical protein